MLIFFCATCEATVPEEAIRAGMAVQMIDRVYCHRCVMSRTAKVPESAVQRAVSAQKIKSGIRSKISRVSARLIAQFPDNSLVRAAKRISRRYFRPGSSPRNRIDPRIKATLAGIKEKQVAAHNLAFVAAICGCVIFCFMLALLAMGGKKQPTKPPEPIAQAPVATPASPSTPATSAPPIYGVPPAEKPVAHPVTPTAPATVAATLPAPNGNTPPPLAPLPPPNNTAVIPPLLIERDSGPVSTTDFKAGLAQDRLNEARSYHKENPANGAAWEKQLNSIIKTYPNTAAADEAGRLLGAVSAVTAPPVLADTLDWFGAWQIENLDKRASVQMYKELNGEKFVLETVPPEAAQALHMKRKIAVPEGRPILELYVRSRDEGAFEFEVEVNGKKTAPQSIAGAEWKIFSLDLSASKGEEILLTLHHRAPEAKNDFAYWKAPQFLAKPDADAQMLTFDNGKNADVISSTGLPLNIVWKNAINLLPLLDPLQDAVAGAWKIQDGALFSDKAFYSRIEIPFEPPQEYDLRITFTRLSGNDSVSQILSFSGRPFSWSMGGSNNKVFGFETIGGISALGNPSTVSRPNCLVNGRKYDSVVQVRANGVKAWLDGELISQWKTDYHDMDIYPEWKLRNPALPGLGCWDSATVFHTIQLREVTGKGKAIRAKPVSSLAALSLKAEYEKVLSDSYSALASKGLNAALLTLEMAKANPALAPVLEKLELDGACISSVQGLHDGVLAGAEKLSDGRAFTLVKTDGKQIAVGADSSNTVKRVANESIFIEQKLAGGAASQELRVNDLTAQTQCELAMLALPPAEANLKIAVAKMPNLFNAASRDTLSTEIQNHLQAARKDSALTGKVDRLQGHLDYLNRDLNAREQVNKIAALFKAADWRAARTLIEDFKTQYVNSFALARAQSALDEWTAKINHELISPVLQR